MKGLLIALLILLLPTTVLAGSPPSLSTPEDGSTVTSTTLDWQTPSYSVNATNPYRVQVDNNSDFSSPEKDTYTSNTHYTPSLTYGTWYWRVYSRDSSGVASPWSSIWSFIYSASTPSSPSPSSSPSNSPSSSPSNPSLSLVISNTPTQVDDNQSFSVNVSLSQPNHPNTQYYLKGAFVSQSGTNYFGQTLVNGSWVKNSAGFTNQFNITTDSSGNYSGNLTVMADNTDSGFTGTGSYNFKVGQYSSGGDLTWSNSVNMTINQTTSSTDSGSTSSTTKSSSTKSSSKSSPSPTTVLTQASLSPNYYNDPKVKLDSIEGVATQSSEAAQPTQTDSQILTPIKVLGTLFVFSGAGLLVYFLKFR